MKRRATAFYNANLVSIFALTVSQHYLDFYDQNFEKTNQNIATKIPPNINLRGKT